MLGLICSTVLGLGFAQNTSNHLFMRVCDTGVGLACVLRIPDEGNFRYIVYDAGGWKDNGATAIAKVKEIIPAGSDIDWMILSHSDADHLGAVDEITLEYNVKRIVWPDLTRTSATWQTANTAINTEVAAGAIMLRPEDPLLAPGLAYQTGEGVVTFIFGRSKPPSSWGFPTGSSEYNNAGSVVITVEYRGKKIMLTGDAVGRHIGGPAGQCIASEKEMCDNAGVVPIKADVLVAPHHGADNANSNRFINAVAPKRVIFSAGHDYEHPRKDAADRFIAFGIQKKYLFRTDRNDDEGGKEWNYLRIAGTVDGRGDDDVDVKLPRNGAASVKYRSP